MYFYFCLEIKNTSATEGRASAGSLRWFGWPFVFIFGKGGKKFLVYSAYYLGSGFYFCFAQDSPFLP
jgi:hypothetical protein